MENTIIGLKELRGNIDRYATKIKKGGSFLVMRKSEPLFKIVPVESEERWETVADFTVLNKNGISAREILKELHKFND